MEQHTLPLACHLLSYLLQEGRVEIPCPLGKVLTYKNLIIKFPFYCINTYYLVEKFRITTQWMSGSSQRDLSKNSGYHMWF